MFNATAELKPTALSMCGIKAHLSCYIYNDHTLVADVSNHKGALA